MNASKLKLQTIINVFRIPIIPCEMNKHCPSGYVCTATVCIKPELICNSWCNLKFAPVCDVICKGIRSSNCFNDITINNLCSVSTVYQSDVKAKTYKSIARYTPWTIKIQCIYLAFLFLTYVTYICIQVEETDINV